LSFWACPRSRAASAAVGSCRCTVFYEIRSVVSQCDQPLSTYHATAAARVYFFIVSSRSIGRTRKHIGRRSPPIVTPSVDLPSCCCYSSSRPCLCACLFLYYCIIIIIIIVCTRRPRGVGTNYHLPVPIFIKSIISLQYIYCNTLRRYKIHVFIWDSYKLKMCRKSLSVGWRDEMGLTL